MIPWIIFYTSYAFQDFYRICTTKQRKRRCILVSRKSFKTKLGLGITSPKYPKYKLYYSLYDSLDNSLSRGGGYLLRSEFEAIIDKVDRGKLEGKLESFTKFEGNRHSTPHPLLSRSFVTRGHRQPSINILWEHRGGGEREFSTSHQYLI